MKTHLPFVFIFLANALLAQQGSFLVLDDSLRIYPMQGYSELFVDSTAALTFDELRQRDFQANFQALDSTFFETPPPIIFWLKIRVTNHNALTNWRLVLKRATRSDHQYITAHDYVDVFAMNKNGDTHHYQTGTLVPKSKKSIVGNPNLNVILLPIPEYDSLTLFIKVQNRFKSSFHLATELRPQNLEEPINTSEWSTEVSIYMGVAIILALLSFFFFFFVKDWAYFFFGLYATAIFLQHSILHPNGLFVSWFIPEHPWLNEYGWVFFTRAAYICFALFGRSFVNLRSLSKRLDNLLLVMIVFILLMMVKSFFEIAFGQYTRLAPSIMIIFFGIILLGLRIFFLPGNLTKIFGTGAAWSALFALMGILWESGTVAIPFNPWPIGVMGAMVIYTFGLAYKLQINEQAKAEAKRVLELDAVKSRFFANISHEFRTPLTLILGPLKKAEEQLPASDIDQTFQVSETWKVSGDAEISLPARHLGMMRRNAERLQQLIDQLLDLSKLENGSMKLQVAEGEVVPFVRAMVFSFESLAERRQIHFQTSFPDRGRKAYFDQDKLEKILVNLLSNAFKYTPEKGKVSVVTTLENGRLKVSVADSGPGISKENLDKIFERFYSLPPTPSKGGRVGTSPLGGGWEGAGTGIGLSLVKELVELHRGQISVESASSKGTVFKVSLPVGKESFLPEEILESTVRQSDSPQSDSWQSAVGSQNMFISTDRLKTAELPTAELKPTLLIVEDNPDLRCFIAETMQAEYQIITAENGKIGKETAIEHTPDLIVSDVMMPEMDGFELCETLKKDERTSHIPIILLTAKAGQRHRVEGLETGADDYLTKPFDEQELLVRAKNLVEQRKKLQAHFAKMTSQSKNGVTPLTPSEVHVTSTDQRFLEKVTTAIERNLDNEFFSVEDLASEVAFSRSQLHRKLKALTGKSPNELIREFRLCRAKELLEKGAGNVSEVAMEVGYSSLSYFTRSFKQTFGVSPSEV